MKKEWLMYSYSQTVDKVGAEGYLQHQLYIQSDRAIMARCPLSMCDY